MGTSKLSWFGSLDNNVKVGKLVLQREEEGMGRSGQVPFLLADRTGEKDRQWATHAVLCSLKARHEEGASLDARSGSHILP